MLTGYARNWVTIGNADPYAVEGYSLVEALPPILIFLSVLGLGIAWRWERLGGAITLVFLFATILLLLIQNPLTQDFYRIAIPYLMSMVIAIPNTVLGGLVEIEKDANLLERCITIRWNALHLSLQGTSAQQASRGAQSGACDFALSSSGGRCPPKTRGLRPTE